MASGNGNDGSGSSSSPVPTNASANNIDASVTPTQSRTRRFSQNNPQHQQGIGRRSSASIPASASASSPGANTPPPRQGVTPPPVPNIPPRGGGGGAGGAATGAYGISYGNSHHVMGQSFAQSYAAARQQVGGGGGGGGSRNVSGSTTNGNIGGNNNNNAASNGGGGGGDLKFGKRAIPSAAPAAQSNAGSPSAAAAAGRSTKSGDPASSSHATLGGGGDSALSASLRSTGVLAGVGGGASGGTTTPRNGVEQAGSAAAGQQVSALSAALATNSPKSSAKADAQSGSAVVDDQEDSALEGGDKGKDEVMGTTSRAFATLDAQGLPVDQKISETMLNDAEHEARRAQRSLNQQAASRERSQSREGGKDASSSSYASADGSGSRARRSSSRIDKLEIPDLKGGDEKDGSGRHLQLPSPSSPARAGTSPKATPSSAAAATPISPRSTPAQGISASATPGGGGADNSGISASSALTAGSLSEVPEEDKIRILRRHLVSAEERHAGEAERRGSTPGPPSPAPAAPPNGGGGHGSRSPFGAGSRANSSNGLGTPKGSRPIAAAAGDNVFGGDVGHELAPNGNNDQGGASGISRKSSRSGNASGFASIADGPPQQDEHFPIPYDAVGGDITHGIYKWQQAQSQAPTRRRSLSFSGVQRENSLALGLDPSLQHIHEPGGFRRQFVINRAVERGEEEPRVLRSFIDFLYLYGHFAGEDLDEEEDESDDEDLLPTHASDAAVRQRHVRGVTNDGERVDERTALLGSVGRSLSRPRMHKRSKSKSVGAKGDANVWQATLMGFVGTGVLFLGKAFFNGGILFSFIVMLGIAAISLWSFLLLVKTRLVVPGSFGDIGGILYGNSMRTIILTSIALSQIGFVAAYTIFVAENLQAFVLGVSNCATKIAIKYLIAAQLLVVLPLAMVRNLAALSSTALIADAFILIGLIYIGANEIGTIAHNGVADVQLFNRNDFSLLIGTAVFAFEGIGLIIPITEAMKEPEKFPKVLSGVMVGVASLFALFGVMGYAAYGPDIQTVVIVNLPQDDKFVQAVQFLYTVAIILSLPLQLFPAVRIMENGLFSRSGKHNPKVKWQKNLFRAATVLGCSAISWAGASNLDGFVSFIGSFACVPLCFIYPPMLHLRARAKTRTQRGLDYALITFGVLTTLYTTVQTVRVLLRPSAIGAGGPSFGRCD